MKEAVASNPLIKGFTTNPTLMRKAGVTDYGTFARKAIAAIPHLPISFEVLADDFDTMEREAREIASWGGDTYIKIPITDTRGASAAPATRPCRPPAPGIPPPICGNRPGRATACST